MPRLTPVKWRDLVKRLRALGFDGPFSGGKHLCKGQKAPGRDKPAPVFLSAAVLRLFALNGSVDHTADRACDSADDSRHDDANEHATGGSARCQYCGSPFTPQQT